MNAGFQSILHIWSMKKNLQPHYIQHPGVHSYNEKVSTPNAVDSDVYADVKKKYISGRGAPWNLSTKKNRESLLELEELLEKHYVICVSWRNTQSVSIILSNGIIVSINILCDSPDIDKIVIDKSLSKKLSGFICDAVIKENFMIFSFLEKLQVVLVNFSSKVNTSDWREGEVNKLEPKLSFIDLPGPTGFRVKRNCVCNKQMDLVCIWWAFSNEEAMSWSPSLKDINRSNLVWLSLTGISSVYTIDVISQMRTDGDLLDAVFSHFDSNQLFTLEQLQSSSTKYLIDACVYELSNNRIRKTERTTISTKANVICQSRNYLQDKIVLLCRNGSLVLFDEYKRSSCTTKTVIAATHVTWHPNDIIFLLSNKNGEIQVLDIALNCLSIQLSSWTFDTCNCLRLSQFFFTQPSLQLVSWAQDSGIGPAPETTSCSDDIMVIFGKGPICILRLQLGICTRASLSAVELVCEYIRYDQMKEAVALLNSLHWDQSSYQCFQCLTLIADQIFKLPFDAMREQCLESTIGSFYAPAHPLSEDIIIQYRDDVSRVARRFFHHLLHHKRFKKAFLLAVDIGDKDLFMDIHYLASDVGDKELAMESRKRAFELDSKETDDVNYSSDKISNEGICVEFEQMNLDSHPKLEHIHPLQTLSALSPVDNQEHFEYRNNTTPLGSMNRCKAPNDTLSISGSMVSGKKPNTYINSFGKV